MSILEEKRETIESLFTQFNSPSTPLTNDSIQESLQSELFTLRECKEITKEDILKSKIGVLLNNMRKSKELSENVKSTCSDILQSWKPLMLKKESNLENTKTPLKKEIKKEIISVVNEEKIMSNGNFHSPSSPLINNKEEGEREGEEASGETKKRENRDNDNESSTDSSNIPSNSSSVKRTKRTLLISDDELMGTGNGSSLKSPKKSSFTNIPLVDNVRQKSMEMIKNALSDTINSELAISLSYQIESAIFKIHNYDSSGPSYKSSIRNKYLNLLKSSNTALYLKNSLEDGTLTPEDFAAMTSAEMASPAQKEIYKSIEQDNLSKAKAATAGSEAETDQFRCGRCKQRKCRYYQLQTRSADEPMTTYVTCVNCGNKWKFC